jgi:hypothetical protein
MDIQLVPERDRPAPARRIDYAAIAARYNEGEIGATLRIERVYNTTLFRRVLQNRGLTDQDVEVTQSGKHCYLKRKSDTRMQ